MLVRKVKFHIPYLQSLVVNIFINDQIFIKTILDSVRMLM